jgi:hypothetical protein
MSPLTARWLSPSPHPWAGPQGSESPFAARYGLTRLGSQLRHALGQCQPSGPLETEPGGDFNPAAFELSSAPEQLPPSTFDRTKCRRFYNFE